MRKLLTIFGCVLLLSGMVCAQFSNPIVIQIQNQGSTIATTSSFLRLNCSTNVSCSISGGAVQITASATASSAFSGLTPGTNVGTGNFIFSGVGTNLSATAGATITATTMAWSGLTGFPAGCTNQAITVIGSTVTCATITSTFVDSSIAKTASPTFTGTVTTPALTISGITGSIQCLQISATGVISGSGAGCGGGAGSAFQVNTVALSSATTVNFLNSAATNGLTLTFTNTSLGNIQLGFTGTLSNAGLANSLTTVNSQSCTLGSTCTIPIQTNGVSNTSQAGLNHITSTTNAVGLTITPVNSATNAEKFEITGGTYTGSAATLGTARTLAGNSFNGSANINFSNAFIVQGTTDAGLTGAQFLGALATGLVKNTTTTGVLSIATSTDVIATWTGTCNSTTFLRADGSCQTPAGSGSVASGSTNGFAYYTAATTVGSITPPTANGQYACGYNVTAGVAVVPTCPLAGLGSRAVTGATSTDIILYSDNVHTVDYQGSAAVAVTMATATTLGNSAFVTKLNNWTTGSTTAVTVTPTTWTINGAASLVIAQGQSCSIKVDSSGSAWDAECDEPQIAAGTNITLTRTAFGLSIASTAAGPTFQVDATPLTSSATINYQDATAFNGLTIGFSNPSAGNVKLTLSGTLGNAGLTNSSTTANGQTCTLGSTCNVNVGATAHGIAINEGNGSAIAGTAIGATNTVLLGQTGADPIFGAVPNAALANASVTVNGQTCTLGAGCNVNTGSTAHGVAINEGNGNAIASTGAGSVGQVLSSAGSSADPVYIDVPEVLFIPAANCNNTTAGAGWSIGSGGAASCRAGTNNLGGSIGISDTSSTFATFQITLPEDWDTGSNPFIRFQVSSSDATNAHTIIPSIQVACYKGDGSTLDDVAANAAHSLSTTTLNGTANRFWSTSNVQMNSTDVTGCVAGALMQITVGRATDTATGVARFYGATVTIPRKIVVQAN